MTLRYLMLIILVVLEIMEVVILVKRKCSKRVMIMTGTIAFLMGFVVSALMQYTYFQYDEYTITVDEDKNKKATDNQVYLYAIYDGNREIEDINMTEGYWLDDGEYLVYNKEFQGITNKLVLSIPVGVSRKIIFSKAEFCGKIDIVSDINGFHQKIDLYNDKIIACEVLLPTSSVKSIFLDRIIKIVLFFVIMVMVHLTVYTVVRKICDTRISIRTGTKYAWMLGGGFFILFLVEGGIFADSGTYQNVYYFENYELGFLSRGLIGQLLCEISPYWSETALSLFKMLLMVILVTIVSVSIGRILVSFFDVSTAYLIVSFIIAAPLTSVAFTDQLRSDICFLLLYLLMIIFINRQGFLLVYIPLLCILVILMNETTSLTVIPSVLALILYMYLSKRDDRYKWLFIASSAVSILTALITTVFGKGTSATAEAEFANMRAHYEGELSQWALSAEYYDLGQHLTHAYGDYLIYWKEYLAFMIVALLMLYVIGRFFMAAYRKGLSQKKKSIKWAFAIIIVTAFSPISAMMIAIDFGRYSMIIFWILMADFFTIVYQERISIQAEDLYTADERKKGNALYLFVIVAMLSIFRPFKAVPNDSVPFITEWIEYFETLI